MNWQTIYNENGIEGSVLIEDEKPVRLSVSPADYDGNEVEQAFEKAFPGYKLDTMRWDSPSGEDCVVCPIEEVAISEQIQQQLDRIGVASTEADYGQAGGIDVDTEFEGAENEVKIDDSQEQTVFKAQETLNALRQLPEDSTADDFWGAVKGLEVR